MWSWLSFFVGLMLGTPIALITFALINIQPMQCHCCESDATLIREIDRVKYYLCSEWAEQLDRVGGETT